MATIQTHGGCLDDSSYESALNHIVKQFFLISFPKIRKGN